MSTKNTSAAGMRATFARKTISDKNYGLSSLLLKSLSMPWVISEQLDEYAWTDFKTLFFNRTKLDSKLVTPVDRDEGYIGAICHELLHNLYRHKTRAEGKNQHHWMVACEWSINHFLSGYVSPRWATTLGIMVPDHDVLHWLDAKKLPATTDNFYAYLEENPSEAPPPDKTPCTYCSRASEEHEAGLPQPTDIYSDEEYREILRYTLGGSTVAQKIPWDILLFGGIEDSVEMEYSWTTPNKISEFLPGMRPEKLLSFVWVLDVSPSVSQEMIEAFLSVLQAGIDKYRDAQHRIILFAEKVLQDITVDAGFDVTTLEIETGWGTCLEEVWEILETDLPDYALVLTDLELSPVPCPSHTQIVWGVVGDEPFFTPDYGTIVNLPS